MINDFDSTGRIRVLRLRFLSRCGASTCGIEWMTVRTLAPRPVRRGKKQRTGRPVLMRLRPAEPDPSYLQAGVKCRLGHHPKKRHKAALLDNPSAQPDAAKNRRGGLSDPQARPMLRSEAAKSALRGHRVTPQPPSPSIHRDARSGAAHRATAPNHPKMLRASGRGQG